MALIILGKTRCSLCARVFVDGDEIWGLPIFPAEFGDYARQLSDSAVHAECRLTDPLVQDLLERFEVWQEMYK